MEDIYQYPECSSTPLLPGIWLSLLKSAQTRCSCIIWVQIVEKSVVWERTIRRGMVAPSWLGSCLQTPALALGSCQGSLAMPGHALHWSRPDPDPLTWLPSFDLHGSHRCRFVWLPPGCWLTLITITRLVVLFFRYYGTGPLLAQSQPCTCLGSPLAPGSSSLREHPALDAPWQHLYMPQEIQA